MQELKDEDEDGLQKTLTKVRNLYDSLPEEALEDADVIRWEGYLTAKEDAFEEELEVANMVRELSVTRFDAGDENERWSVELTFDDIEIKDLDGLVISLYRGNTKMGEQEATQANIELERARPGTATSPFFTNGREDEYWTKNMELLSGAPDRVVLTFELDGETYTVRSNG